MAKILILEDNSELQTLYAESLAEKGHTVQGATTVTEAFSSMLQEKPALLVLDIMLPGGANGFDMLDQIKNNTLLADLKVIIITNLDGEEQTARDAGAVDYIVKPNMSLEDTVARIMAQLPAETA